MDYQIREIDLSNDLTKQEVNNLVNKVFNIKTKENTVELNTKTKNNKSRYFAVYFKSKIVAINFFISHELTLNENNIIAHQSCWSATSPNHRKKGLFALLINHAKKVLKDSGSSFIFGFPNKNSEPIFVKKLGFRKIEQKKLNIPVLLLPKFSIKLHLKRLSKNFTLETLNTIIPLESELIELKKQQQGSSIIYYGNYNNLIWGKILERKFFGIKLIFFKVGGFQVNKPKLFKYVLIDLVHNEDIDFIQIVGTKLNSIWNIFNFSINAKHSEPLIFHNLNLDIKNYKFNFFNGIKDVF